MAKSNVKSYNGIADFIHTLETKPAHSSWKQCQSENPELDSWSGGINLKDSIRLGKHGWPEGLARMEKLVEVKRNGYGESWELSVAGVLPDIGAYCAGTPENMWMKQESEVSRNPVIRIAINPSFSSMTNENIVFNYGAAIVEVINSLENAGYAVELELVGVSPSTIGGWEIGAKFPLKHSTNFMDLESVCFFIVHPATLRRLIFRHCELVDIYGKQNDSGYGRETPMDMIKKYTQEGTLIFSYQNAIISGCKDMVSARVMVRGQVLDQRPELLEQV